MNAKLLCALAVVSVALFACDKDKPAAAKPAADVACDAVVAKLAGFNPGSGEPEKKLWTKMCDGMPNGVRACIVAAATLEDSQKCMTDKKLE